ncbi:hypothetical protein K437DRAFT_241728 [Tilletiaria anomala UBC 951]|uniref:GPN-loop GTPase 2 n=1 Tax=Tilletiaria anomala (strain ATCC 24038 / CBS 436.72 / UBC 951) TaxID=1037660 RepID=A0A066WRA7_TILAU|nr:uncharacterized protein K437DRAFT_241728 [Tilletiaria anomala UBC 951]KDN53539.1 hypothetical protein K437DRAFT_241728 [Tilletiaria anomala UBC 951]
MPFGQLVIGSPGSGKTTYCNGMQQFLTALKRPVSVVNLDPANDELPYDCAIDIRKLITVVDVMKELDLGPNGAMLYCMEYLEENFEWLDSQLDQLGPDAYAVFDLPGQVELSTNHPSLRNILDRLQKKDWRLVAVHLTDASHITDAARYVSLLLLSLRAMLMLELPHINVLSKIDLLADHFDDVEFNLDFYTEVQDLSYLEHALERSTGSVGPRAERFRALNRTLCEIIEDFCLVNFETLAVEDKDSMFRLLRLIDKAAGYIYAHGHDPGAETVPDHMGIYEPGSSAATSNLASGSVMAKPPARTAASANSLFTVADRGTTMGWGGALDVQERWVDHKNEWDEWEDEKAREEGKLIAERKIMQSAEKVLARQRAGDGTLQSPKGSEGRRQIQAQGEMPMFHDTSCNT